MDVLILRIIHIGAGAFWVGSVYTFLLFIQPTAQALGPDGQRFAFHLIHHRRLPDVILASGATTVAAGLLLLWSTTNGFDLDVMFQTPRLGFTVGGLAAIVALAVGSLYLRPRTRQVERIVSATMAEGRGPDADEQLALARIRDESRRAGLLLGAALAVAVLAMATARYWALVL